MATALKSYRLRLYPNAAQLKQLAVDFGHARWVWNACLAWRTDAWKNEQANVTGVDFTHEVTFLKTLEPYAWLKDASSVVLTQKLRDQDRAFANFFEGRARYPRFKRKRGPQSVRYTLDQRQIASTFRTGDLLKLPKLGALKVRWSRLPAGIPKMVTITRDAAGRYFASFACEEQVRLMVPTTKAIGVDLGVKDVVVTSDGWKSENPRHLKKRLRKLKHESRNLNRKRKGSNRREHQRARVARLHARIADARRDFLHKLTTSLTRQAQVIAIEDLHVRGMMRNRRLAQAIGDVGMGELRRQLEYKCEWYGRELYVADRFAPTSKACSACGAVQAEMPLKVRAWTCPDCGTRHDRDVNAARNILNFATAGNAAFARERGGEVHANALIEGEACTEGVHAGSRKVRVAV